MQEVTASRVDRAEGHHVWSSHSDSDIPFLFEQRQSRLGSAFGLSVLVHAGVFLLAIFVAQQASRYGDASVTPRLKNYRIVWIPAPGPGGGGGGGGNKRPEPPRLAQLPGKAPVTVPVTKAPKLDNPEKPKDEPKPEQQLTIPAQALGAEDQTIAGVIEGLPSATGTTSQGIGSGGGAGSGTGTGIGSGTGSGLGPGFGGGTGGGAYRPGSGVELPRVVREVKPQYTADAMRAKVQGTVWLEAIVMPDGSVGNVEVVKSLDSAFGLDQEALKAAKQWRFIPGKRFGEPVAVIVTIELTFTLR